MLTCNPHVPTKQAYACSQSRNMRSNSQRDTTRPSQPTSHWPDPRHCQPISRTSHFGRPKDVRRTLRPFRFRKDLGAPSPWQMRCTCSGLPALMAKADSALPGRRSENRLPAPEKRAESRNPPPLPEKICAIEYATRRHRSPTSCHGR